MYAIRSYASVAGSFRRSTTSRALLAVVAPRSTMPSVSASPRAVSTCCRITSYNVCYTKLLRPDSTVEGARGEQHQRVFGVKKNVLRVCIPEQRVLRVKVRCRISRCHQGSCQVVITSYSIHYTKLYEGVRARYLIGFCHFCIFVISVFLF